MSLCSERERYPASGRTAPLGRPLRCAGLLVLVLLLGAAFASRARAELDGAFETIMSPPAPHSLDAVMFEEYFNFTCPHCNAFRTAAQPLKERYAKRLRIVNIPIMFRGQTDAPLRLFYIAQSLGREEEIKTLIFDAAFRYGVNPFDPQVTSYLARSSGLGDAYAKDGNAIWVTRKVEESMAKADQAGVRATPTVVLQGALRVLPEAGMSQFVGNLDRLIAQLLK
jgi:thiol:disulfide interchange protein DsbA